MHTNPNDLIKRLGIDGLNKSADEYYRQIGDLTNHHMKPCSSLMEAPVLLYHLGLVLGGSRIAPGMSVMDFGCGVGWLGRLLLQMGCDVLFLDVAATAIAAAEQFSREHPPVGTSPFSRRATFSVFDGRRIDAPDGSLDRIVCFGALHHTSNPHDVIREFHRVLKADGVAAFYEPGVGHSSDGASQHEMREFNALENDIDLASLTRSARDIGFKHIYFHLTHNPLVVADESEFLTVHDNGLLPEALSNLILAYTRCSYIFFLAREESQSLDSRQHLGLRAAIELVHPLPQISPGADRTVSISLTVQNRGTSKWLSHTTSSLGVVKLGVHLAAADGHFSDNDYARAHLPFDVYPGGSVNLDLKLSVPSNGNWRITLDLVSEGVCWFESVGSKPLVLEIDFQGE